MMQGIKDKELFRQQCYINGQWTNADSDKTISVVNPFNQDRLGHVPECTQIETKRAIEAAHAAFPAWKNLTAQKRADYLWALSALITEHKEDLAIIMTLEQGKPLSESRSEIEYANSFISWFAEEARRVYGDVISSNVSQQHLIVLKQPIGVVAAITPWNFPAAMITRKIAPALAAGCTVVVKPDSATPFSALALAVLAEKAGFPAGVFNVVTGVAKDIGSEMTAHPLVKKISFTGSTAVGRLLMQAAAPTIKKLSLELGGNAPFIVFDDADMDAAIKGAIASKFRNSGQTCVCANRFFIHESIYAEFTERLVKAVKQLKLGNGLDPGVQLGPLINQKAIDKVKAHIEDAVTKGAKIVCGGTQSSLGDLFFEPTVLINANASMRLAQEETFGPVAALFKFKAEEEVVQMANDTEFGLASYFYSNNMPRVWRVAQALEDGIVGVNVGIISTEVAPFGGVKQSGIGREGSKYGMEDYLEIKYLCMGS